jgi:hypothetical protein
MLHGKQNHPRPEISIPAIVAGLQNPATAICEWVTCEGSAKHSPTSRRHS